MYIMRGVDSGRIFRLKTQVIVSYDDCVHHRLSAKFYWNGTNLALKIRIRDIFYEAWLSNSVFRGLGLINYIFNLYFYLIEWCFFCSAASSDSKWVNLILIFSFYFHRFDLFHGTNIIYDINLFTLFLIDIIRTTFIKFTEKKNNLKTKCSNRMNCMRTAQ